MEQEPARADFFVEERTPQPSIEEINDWVRQAQSGCGESFGRLYSAFQARVLKYVTCRVGPNDAEDVTSRAFLKAFSGLPTFEVRGAGSFSGWLFRIAHNEAADHWRSKKETLAMHEVLESGSVCADLTRVEDVLDLNSAFGELPPQHQPVVYLKYVEGRSHQEIAHTLKIPVNSSQVFAKRGLDKLRRILERVDSPNKGELAGESSAA